MAWFKTQRTWATWLAMCVLVWGTLAPTVAHAALLWGDRTHWVEVCTGTGMAWVQLPPASGHVSDTPTPSPATGAIDMECPWCLQPQAGVVGAPLAATTRIYAHWQAEPPAPEEQIAYAMPMGCCAYPRAPPAHA